MKGIEALRAKDLLVIYRMSDGQGPAEYRSVATSICVVEEVRDKHAFSSIAEYLSYTQPFSVFDEAELKHWWKRENTHVIKMTYNAAFMRRVIRKTLADDIGLDRGEYWGFMGLTRGQFLKVADAGGVDARLIIR